jgi:predicted DNA-binding transcriptional regulator YafY
VVLVSYPERGIQRSIVLSNCDKHHPILQICLTSKPFSWSISIFWIASFYTPLLLFMVTSARRVADEQDQSFLLEPGGTMRADRLLSLMMLLQTRGQMTAEELSVELEVSKRTIYRDIEALSIAGVPVYASGGPGGGYALLDSYRTSLTGLNENEIRALFMLTIPGPISDLGVSQQLKAAILKLTSSFANEHYEHTDFLRQRLHLDAASWFQTEEPVPHLKIIQEAAWQDRQLVLAYRRRNSLVSEQIVSPYGLVAKASIWYLVAATDKGMRVYRVSRINSAQMTQTHFARTQDFELAKFWTDWVVEYQASLPKYPVILRVAPDLIPILPSILGDDVRVLIEQAQPDSEGWRVVKHTFERIEEAQTYVLGMGTSVDVIAPEELRANVLKLATAVIAHYSQRNVTRQQ